MATTTVTGTWLKPNGDPASGRVTFRLVAATYHDGLDAIFPQTPVTAVLDADGAISIELEPTSGVDADFDATDMTYEVIEKISGAPRDPYYVDIPTAAGVDLGTLVTYEEPQHVTRVLVDVDAAALGIPALIADHAAAADPHTGYLTEVAANATYQPLGKGFRDIGAFAGVDPTGVTECATAINTALATIAAAGLRAYGSGSFKIASTVTIAANADLGDATFNYTGASGTAVLIGTTTSGDQVTRIDVIAPRIVGTAKTVTGWAQVAGTIGVDIHNLYESRVWVPYVNDLETGVRFYGTGTGCVYNHIAIGHAHNNKVNLKLDANASGWANENIISIGRLSHESAEGTAVSGVRHIVTAVCTNAINNNLFLKPCIEGNVTEFDISCGGLYNRFVQGRYESTPKVRWDSDAAFNLIDGGYGSGNIAETWVSGASRNDIHSHYRNYVTKSGGTSGVVVIENASSSAYPADVVMDPGARSSGASPVTAYRVQRGADYTRMKRATDTYDRLQFDHTNGRVYFGTNAAAPNSYISGGSGYLYPAGHLYFLADNTFDIGSTSPYRPRDLFLGRNAVIGGDIEIDGALNHDGSTVGFYGTTPAAKPTVTGSRGGNAALASLLTALAGLGLLTDSTSA